MRARAPGGRSARTRRWSGRISTPPGHAGQFRPGRQKRAESNDKNPGGGADREGIGRSRGGLSTKIHLAADRRCRPVARRVTPGQRGDCPELIPLLNQIRVARRGRGRPRTRPGTLLADKAYSSAATRDWLRHHQIRAVIPERDDQKKHRKARGRSGGRPPAFDSGRYKDRNTVERCYSKLKQSRAVATRYDKRQQIFQGTIDIASIRIWLRDPADEL